MPNHPMENSTLSPSAYRNDLPTSKKVPLATTKLKPTTNPLVTLVNNHPDLPLAKSPQIKHHSISSPKSPWVAVIMLLHNSNRRKRILVLSNKHKPLYKHMRNIPSKPCRTGIQT